jgi:hypothetical protein
MVTMKTTDRLSLDASGVLNIVTTMTCNGSAWHDDHGVQERGVAESRNNSCENPRVGGSAGANPGNESPERSSSESL